MQDNKYHTVSVKNENGIPTVFELGGKLPVEKLMGYKLVLRQTPDMEILKIR
jgi:hypothetical protein